MSDFLPGIAPGNDDVVSISGTRLVDLTTGHYDLKEEEQVAAKRIVKVETHSDAPRDFWDRPLSAAKTKRILALFKVNPDDFKKAYEDDRSRGPGKGSFKRVPEPWISALRPHGRDLEQYARAIGLGWKDDSGKRQALQKARKARQRALEQQTFGV